MLPIDTRGATSVSLVLRNKKTARDGGKNSGKPASLFAGTALQ